MTRRETVGCVDRTRGRSLCLRAVSAHRAAWLFATAPLIASCAVAVDSEPLFGEVGAGGSAYAESDSGAAYPGAGGNAQGAPTAVPSMPGARDGSAANAPPQSGVCNPGLKACGGLCIEPAPSVGCELTSCTPCPPAPANAEPLCVDGQCSWQCAAGFALAGSECIEDGFGGAVGTDGLQGASGAGGSTINGSGGAAFGAGGSANDTGGTNGAGGWGANTGGTTGSGGWQSDDAGAFGGAGDDAGASTGSGGRGRR